MSKGVTSSFSRRETVNEAESPRTTVHLMLVGLAPKVSEDKEVIRTLYIINKKPVPEVGMRESIRHWLFIIISFIFRGCG
jgi:hypothetical protein